MGNAFAFAARLLSSLPPLSLQAPTREEARRSVALFPLVGALLGLLTACVWNLAAHLWAGNTFVLAAVTLAAGAVFTAGRAWKGLARAGDGLAAHSVSHDRAHAFAIMRDPRRGTTGIIVVIVGIGLQIAFLSGLPPVFSWTGLVLAGALGRWATAFGLAAFPLASASTADPEAAHGLMDAGPQEFLGATLLAVLFAVLLPVRGMVIFAVVALVVGASASAIQQRLGGLSLPLAHALGAVGELTALACLAIHPQ